MKKFWKNNKGWIIALAVVLLLVVGTVLSEGVKEEEKPIDITTLSEEVQSWYGATQEDKYVVTVLAGSNCQYCANFKPVMEEVAKEEELDLRWFYVDQQEDKDAKALEELYNLQETGSVPYMYITYKGELVTYNVGYMEKSALVDFLKENEVIK